MNSKTVILAAAVGAAALSTTACGSSGPTGSASQRTATPLAGYANANQIVQALKAHHVLATNVVADSGFWSGEGAASGVWATTAPGDSAAVFGGSENPVQDTEIVVFQNHAKAVAYANLSINPTTTPDPDHETILGTNWAVDAATPAAPSIRAALGGTPIPNVPASAAPASQQPAPPSASSKSATAPSPASPSPAQLTMTKQTDVVVFKVTGSGYPSISYGTDSINDQASGGYGPLGDGNALPWLTTLPYNPNALYYAVNAQLEGSGSITDSVTEVVTTWCSDGSKHTESFPHANGSASGGYAIANAEYTGGDTGDASQAESDAGC